MYICVSICIYIYIYILNIYICFWQGEDEAEVQARKEEAAFRAAENTEAMNRRAAAAGRA